MIFWFSATGNSQHAAEKIAAVTGDRLISIGAALRDGRYDYDISGDTRLGFVVPTFAWTLPAPVYMFIERLRLSGYKSQYVYAVLTCGESSGGESSALYQALKARGISFDGSFDLVMPDNFIVWSQLPEETELKRRLHFSESELGLITDKIKLNKLGSIDSSKPQSPYMPAQAVSTLNGTSKLYVTDKCTGCGLCEQLCPMKCISMSEGRPVWDGNCCMCLACLHRCPAAAIEHGGDTAGKKRYTHPAAKLKLTNEY